MSSDIKLHWSTTQGCIVVELPSGTSLHLSRQDALFVHPFLDALHLIQSHDPAWLLRPITEKQFRGFYARWRADGNKALEAALDEMDPTKRDRLSQTQIDTLRDKYLQDGKVVVKPLQRTPKGINLDDLII